MSASTDKGHFFQTSSSLERDAHRTAKAGNKRGDPIEASSKILALLPDPLDAGRVYVGESGGLARRVELSVSNLSLLSSSSPSSSYSMPHSPKSSSTPITQLTKLPCLHRLVLKARTSTATKTRHLLLLPRHTLIAAPPVLPPSP